MTFAPDSPLVTHVVPADPTNVLRAVNHPKVIVLHTPEEPSDNYESTPVYFSQPNRSASTHYYADSDGDLYQMVPEAHGAIANGVKGKPYPAGTDPAISLNYQSVNIEIEGYAATIGQTLTARQRTTVLRWIVSCATRYGIPIDRAHVIGHYEVADNRSDPGTLDIDALVREAQALAAPPDGLALVKAPGVAYTYLAFALGGRWRWKHYVASQAELRALVTVGPVRVIDKLDSIRRLPD